MLAGPAAEIWRCSQCSLPNYHKGNKCCHCNKVQAPEAGTDSSEWACPTCTFLNSKSSAMCDMCTTPRPGFSAKVRSFQQEKKEEVDESPKLSEGERAVFDHSFCFFFSHLSPPPFSRVRARVCLHALVVTRCLQPAELPAEGNPSMHQVHASDRRGLDRARVQLLRLPSHGPRLG